MASTRAASYTDRVISQVTAWPAVSASRADCGSGVGLSVNSHQIVHLHDPGRAQVRLTRPVIRRMEQALRDSGQVQIEGCEDWVSVRLDSDNDVSLLVSLVSVAIKAVCTDPPGVSHRESAPCQGRTGRRESRWRRH